MKVSLVSRQNEMGKYRQFWRKWWPVTMIIGASAVLTVLVLGIKAVRRLAESRELESISTLFDELFAIENLNLRRSVYNTLPSNAEEANDEQWEIAQRVEYSFDKLGFLVEQHLLSKQYAVDMCYTVVVRMWNKLEPYVREGRKRRGEDPQTGRHSRYFELLANHCLERWKKEGLPETPDYFKMIRI